MRTTLNLDPDVLAAARALAEAGGRPLGAVVSDLARRGLVLEGKHPPAAVVDWATALARVDALRTKLNVPPLLESDLRHAGAAGDR